MGAVVVVIICPCVDRVSSTGIAGDQVLVHALSPQATNEIFRESILHRLPRRHAEIRKWWWVDTEGACYLQLRYGASVIELEKNKPAILVEDNAKLLRLVSWMNC